MVNTKKEHKFGSATEESVLPPKTNDKNGIGTMNFISVLLSLPLCFPSLPSRRAERGQAGALQTFSLWRGGRNGLAVRQMREPWVGVTMIKPTTSYLFYFIFFRHNRICGLAVAFKNMFFGGFPCREKLIAPGMQRIEYAVIHKTRRSKKELHNIVDK